MVGPSHGEDGERVVAVRPETADGDGVGEGDVLDEFSLLVQVGHLEGVPVADRLVPDEGDLLVGDAGRVDVGHRLWVEPVLSLQRTRLDTA